MDNHQIPLKVYRANYSSADALSVAGINDVTLQNWLARGHLNLGQQNPGRGKARQFTAYEIARIRFVKKLVDLQFPLAPAFKITAAIKKLWESAPRGHEVYASEPNLRSWLLVVASTEWKTRQRGVRFPLDYSSIPADDYVAIWAVEIIGGSGKHSMQDALQFFEDSPVIVINMALLLQQTLLQLEKLLLERPDD